MKGNQSLSRSLCSGGIKAQMGGYFPEGDQVAGLYDRTGSMAVARTLANYQKPNAQNGIQGNVYGERNEQGRVYKDAQDEANQIAREGSKTDPFQIALRKAERENAGKGPGQFMYDTGDGRGPQPYAIGVGTTATNQDGGVNIQGGSAATGGAGGGDVAWSDPEFDAEMDAWQPTIDEGGAGGAGAGGDANWWEMNRANIGRGFNDVIEGYTNIAPHLANIRDYKQLRGVQAPMLQRSVPLEKPSLESYKQSIIAQGRNMQNQAGYDTSQSGGQSGQRAAALAKTQSELSRLAGYEGNLLADIANKQKMADSQIESKNLANVNTYYDDVAERDLYKTKGMAQERGKIAQNILGFIGGQNQRKLDQSKNAFLDMQFASEGTQKRALDKAIKEGNWKAVEALTAGRGIQIT